MKIEYTKDGTILTNASKSITQLNLSKQNALRTIGPNTFYGSNLEKIKFNNELENIEECAFFGTKLSEIIINNQIKIAKNSFSYLDFLEKVNINCIATAPWCFACNSEKTDGADIILKNTTLIDTATFEKSKIKSIVLPDTLKCISFNAFAYTYFQNTKLILPNKVEAIVSNAFLESNLTDIYIPDSIEYIGNLQDMNINIHMSKKAFKRLELKTGKYIIIEDDSLEKLLETNSFKEINQKVLNKEIVI